MGKRRTTRQIFLLSPANLAGRRAEFLLGPNARCELAMRLRLSGAPLGEVFSFVSGLYFRGKLAYANAFAVPSDGPLDSVFIITSGHGLIPPRAITSLSQLHEMAEVSIHISNPRYRLPLERALRQFASQIGERDRVVLLGSVATPKYLDPLRQILGDRLMIPAAFIGMGDMCRGALMLRAVREGKPLDYVSLDSQSSGGHLRRVRRP
jgi:hypothetical protein